jgi:hypothetical protein
MEANMGDPAPQRISRAVARPQQKAPEKPIARQAPAQGEGIKEGNYTEKMKALDGLQTQQAAVKPPAPEESPELKAFKAKKHEVINFNSPTTKMGLFDLSFDPATSVAKVTVRVNYDFQSGDAKDYEDAKPAELTWTDDAKTKWKADFQKTVTEAWGGKFNFACKKTGFESVHASVAVEVVEVDKDWHFQLRVARIPKGGFRGSSISTYLGSSKRGINYGTLDSEDLTGTKKRSSMKTKQVGAVHEFGHMLGLDDEYEDVDVKDGAVGHASLVKDALGKEISRKDSDDVMSCGANLGQQHYVTILEALKQATSIKEWGFEDWTRTVVRMLDATSAAKATNSAEAKASGK